MSVINIWLSFLAGLYAPLGAVCVIPLYPGFISYLSFQKKSKPLVFGVLILFGAMLSMGLFGLIFTAILQKSLSQAIHIISPVAFVILALVSLLLILNLQLIKLFPSVKSPLSKNPYGSALLFGMFFGLIILPCNPAALIVLFSLSTTFSSQILSLMRFIAFGIGMGLPLLFLAMLGQKSKSFIAIIIKHNKIINRISGIIMLLISMYYLLFVF